MISWLCYVFWELFKQVPSSFLLWVEYHALKIMIAILIAGLLMLD